MAGPWSEGGIDPEFASGVREGAGGNRLAKLRAFIERLGGAIADVPQTIGGAISNRPEMEAPERPYVGEPLEEEAGDFVRDWRTKDAPTTATGEGAMDEGRMEYGVDMPEGGTPRVAAEGQPESRMEYMEQEPEQELAPVPDEIDAEVDFIFGGEGVVDTYSRMRALFRDLGAGTDEKMLGMLNDLYYETTGQRPNWRSSMDAVRALDPDTFKAMILGAE